MAESEAVLKLRPRAEHVGSLLRPRALGEAMSRVYEPDHAVMLAQERERDLSELRAVEDQLIREAVHHQEAAGLDVVSDGEYRRRLFVNSFYDAVDGLTPSEDKIVFHGDTGDVASPPGLPVIERRLQRIDSPGAREATFLAQTTRKPFKITFPAASWFLSPFMVPPDQTVPGYESPEELGEHAIAILRELVAETIAAGARYIQFDYPTYVYVVDEGMLDQLRTMGVDPESLVERCIQADRAVLEGLPADVHTALHLCRGNYRSRWMFRGSLEPVAERMFSELPYDSFLIEWEDVGREGDYSPLRFVPKGGPTIAMGMISSKHPALESEDDVLRRIDAASKVLGIDQLALCPQCGFASNWEGNELDEQAQWRKLELVGRIAERLWPNR
ncbi:MAG: 5-methyltetrahydropteroyltriglutamate--homocysteine S-methyltransferase [Solirubrobacteraceae bacterium]